MYKGFLHTHYLVVTLFLLFYFVKTFLLISNKQDALKKISKTFRVPEMIISFLFLTTGIYLACKAPEINFLLVSKICLVLVSIPIAIIGFKKENKILAALSLFMLVASFGIAEVYHKKVMQATTSTNAKVGIFVASTYYEESSNCIRCHGSDGKLGGAGASDLSTSNLDKSSISLVIRNGKGLMGGYKNLSQAESDLLADYVLSLREK